MASFLLVATLLGVWCDVILTEWFTWWTVLRRLFIWLRCSHSGRCVTGWECVFWTLRCVGLLQPWLV